MSLALDRSPVLVGVGQHVERDVDPREALDPIGLMEVAARRAADDAGVGERLFERVAAVAVVGILSASYRNPARLLAERLGIPRGEEWVTTTGGNSPQSLVNAFARRIQSGELDLVLIAGGEAFRTRRLARRAGVTLAWPSGGAGTPQIFGDPRPGSSEIELAHGLALPAVIYPLIENALRARHGWSLDEHLRRLGELCSRFTEVAARNPYAWFPERRTPEEIVTTSRENRRVAFPYTKRMNAILEVNQGACVLLASRAQARATGVPEPRWVHLWGGGDAVAEPWFLSERPDLSRAPALGHAAGLALGEAGLGVDDLDFFDFYSCFPCAVEVACDELGLAFDESRPLTVTGGLPYAGGPGNAYTLHAIARMAEALRSRPGARGLVTAVGWYLTKHAAGVYACAPPPERRRPAPPPPPPREAPRAPVPEAEGRGRIETYTVVFDREGAPRQGIVLGRLNDGRRFLANTPPDRTLLESFCEREAIGLEGRVSGSGKTLRFDPD